jgi:hypothetical protein
MVRQPHAPTRVAALALAVALALSACSDDPPRASGPTADEPAVTGESGAPPASESPPHESSGEATGPGGGLIEPVNLCVELDLATLRRLTGLRLGAGAFDGARCTWTDPDGRETLTMGLGRAEGDAAAHVQEIKDLDIGEEVTVAGTDDAAAVTITSGSGESRTTRVSLVAKVGRDELTVVLTGRRASLETVVALAELATGG